MACVRKRRKRWVLDFQDQNGKRRWVTMPKGTTKDDANEKLGKVVKKIRRGTYIPRKDLPHFSEVAENWLASKEPNIRHSTYKQYKGHVEVHLKPFFGRLKINHVTFDTIEQFKKDSTENGVTPPTLRKILINLGAILSYAVRIRYIDYNPAREIEKPRGKTTHDDEDEMFIFKPYQIQAMLQKTDEQKFRLLFMTAVLTGLRQGELFGLQWGDIDWTNCQIHVRRTYNHGHFYGPKSKTSRRSVDMGPERVDEFKRWKLACPIGGLDLIFPSNMGTPLNAAAVLYRKFLPALRRAGLPRIRFHNLRHTYASLLVYQGEHPKYIQSQLGHSSIQVTMDVYGHLMETVNRGAATKLGRTVMGDSGQNCSSWVAETKTRVNQNG
jgi:integrase